ncbi:conserved hypothetical protein [Culex quinquefasciatus]|uniref:Uncharacterized protein n=1 Tax=Culex quinquefasciatus TaxID=7176 RepID=B0X9S3_CULQU|nr:conserved hypothetical protein [Culex quinquefasciatus]|eukprot:XP_001866395.1 conserved hypothetical protein [Culex quinquefasciatus]
MANTLDLSLAIRVVGKYDGDAAELENWLNDVTVLRAGQSTVDEAVFVQFMNNRLTGAARVAVTAELRGLKQKDKSLVDFGNEIEKVAARLAAAWVSKQQQLFPTEAATRPIVEPIAVEAFINGLKDQSKVLQMRSRNPETLTKALSDALEIHAQPMPEEVMWTYASYSNPGFRGRGRGKKGKFKGNRGFQNNRNFENQNDYNQQGYNQQGYNQQQQGYNSNRGHRGNRGYQHNRGGGNRGVANVAQGELRPQQQQQQPQQPREEKKNTVGFDFGRDGVMPTLKEAITFLVQVLKIKDTEVHSVYLDISDKTFFVKFTDEMTLKETTQRLRQTETFKYADGREVQVHLFNLPPEVTDAEIAKALAKFGTVRQLVREKLPLELGFNSFSGTRGA